MKTDWISKRYLIAVLAFFGFANVYALRVNLSVAIVVMTSNYTVNSPHGPVVVVSSTTHLTGGLMLLVVAGRGAVHVRLCLAGEDNWRNYFKIYVQNGEL